MAAAYTPAHAEGFIFGDETKGALFTADDAKLNIRLGLQPRLDYGEIIKSKDGNSYSNDKDLYMRAIALDLRGNLNENIRYCLVIVADKYDKANFNNQVNILFSYMEWLASPGFGLMIGKEKLPFSRISLSSTFVQLFIERPVSSETAKKAFGKTDVVYHNPKLEARGGLLEGVVRYYASVSEGWTVGEPIQSNRTVYKGGLLYAGRLELAPPDWVEAIRSDAHIGRGKHLSFGIDYAVQPTIIYNETDYKEKRALWSVDLSGHYKGFTGQIEYNEWRADSEDPAIADTNPKGWYAQAAYIILPLYIEPAVRYEVFDQDSKNSGKKERTTTLGVNWYLKGHSLKSSLNWVHTKYDVNATGKLPGDDDKDIYQLQAQMLF